jgi:anti-sigma factor RsiW
MSERNHVKDQLAEYAVGGLSGRARARIEMHLRGCAECREELAALERTGELLAAVPLEDAPAGTWGAVRQRIAPRAQTPARRAPLRWAWGTVGVAALVVIMLGAFLLWPLGGGGPGLVIATEPDDELAATIEGHLPTVWAAPLADEAAVGLRLAAMEEGG